MAEIGELPLGLGAVLLQVGQDSRLSLAHRQPQLQKLGPQIFLSGHLLTLKQIANHFTLHSHHSNSNWPV